jgi:DNA-binding NarL/FixJ family response regulator
MSVLTRREREVLQLAADGLWSIAIAEALVVSPGTVKTHFQNIYAKLGAGNRASAVAHRAAARVARLGAAATPSHRSTRRYRRYWR